MNTSYKPGIVFTPEIAANKCLSTRKKKRHIALHIFSGETLRTRGELTIEEAAIAKLKEISSPQLLQRQISTMEGPEENITKERGVYYFYEE